MKNNLSPQYIQDLTAYSSAKSEKLIGSTWLNANESPFNKVYDFSFDDLNRYPDPQPQNVISRYARYTALKESQVLMTRGADEGIELLIRTFCQNGQDTIVQFTPTYGMYKVTADSQNIGLNELTQAQLQTQDIATLKNDIGDAKLVFICNPNNPTGERLSLARIREICGACQNRNIVVIDEAYIEFCIDNSAINLINEFDNVVVLRTLSKAFGLAGLRCGFTLTNTDLMSVLKKVIAPYPVPTPVAKIAEMALSVDNIASVKRQVSIIKSARADLTKTLRQSTAVSQVLDSEANFVTLKLKSQHAFAIAKRRGLIMRPFTLENSDLWLRISIGSAQELAQVNLWLAETEQEVIENA